MPTSQKKTRLDFPELWETVADKAYNNFEALSSDERALFTVGYLIDSTNNGGILAHYCNIGANYNAETLADLEYLGFTDVADMLREINKLFPGGKAPTDINERNEVMETWEYSENEDLFEDLDQDFYRREEAMEDALVKHIEGKLV
ncbi:DMP19 family protein [Mucilaginibacter pedocola]|uniref:DNA mimic protein DMP19 C-terminal domain-containing protein n=1 Tax=Mucilaginibacter pedocola TaxID=1792845 RepID=A0A1S9PBD0_9SPHI|nr:DUF4375 domain-containing protein [Mucilaginibacter pedocola]OOQ58229.1 hypothetical protein BC343_11340 [Mucilaginibacter pedocola]